MILFLSTCHPTTLVATFASQPTAFLFLPQIASNNQGHSSRENDMVLEDTVVGNPIVLKDMHCHSAAFRS